MNDYDSARIVDLMAKNGYERVAAPEEADLVVIVTCSIREKAQEKTFSDLGRIREIKKKNPELLIAVGGCVASQEGKYPEALPLGGRCVRAANTAPAAEND